MSYSGQSLPFGYPAGVTMVDVVPPHIKHLVHPHWNTFAPVNPMWHYFLGVTYIFLFIVAFIGNAVVISLYLNVRKLRTPSNLLIFNLSLLDMLMVITNYPVFIYNSLSGGMWLFSVFYCELYSFFGAVSGIGGVYSLVCITYDRYNVLSGHRLSFGTAWAMVAFIWVNAIGISIQPFRGWGRFIPEGTLDTCTVDYLSLDDGNRSFIMFILFWAYVLPLCCLFYFFFAILNFVSAHEASSEEERVEMRIGKVTVYSVVLWIICWTPYCFLMNQSMFFDQSKVTPLAAIVTVMLAKSYNTYNPLVYAMGHPRFRAAMQKHVSWCCVNEECDIGASKSMGTV